jgi:hypothetical protein
MLASDSLESEADKAVAPDVEVSATCTKLHGSMSRC